MKKIINIKDHFQEIFKAIADKSEACTEVLLY